MNIQAIKQPEKRFENTELSKLDIQSYGVDNLYPQRVREVIAASASGKVCTTRYARFIEGGGFGDAGLYDYVVNAGGDTMDDLLKRLTVDLAYFGGCVLHVNYNALGEIISLTHVPFEHCRLTLPDDSGYVAKVAVFADWSGTSKRGGKVLKPTPDTVDYIDAFNPRFAQSQMAALENPELYKGQILYHSMDGAMVYPTPVADSVITDMSSDEGLANVRYRNVRNNFLPAGMMCKKKAQSTDPSNDQDEDQEFFDSLKAFQGDAVSNKLFGCTYSEGEEPPAFKPFMAANFDKEFDYTEKTVKDTIYSAFEQEPFLRISTGSLGFSSEIMQQAYEYYSSLVYNEQRQLERIFTTVFKHWGETVASNFSILPKKYANAESSNG